MLRTRGESTRSAMGQALGTADCPATITGPGPSCLREDVRPAQFRGTGKRDRRSPPSADQSTAHAVPSSASIQSAVTRSVDRTCRRRPLSRRASAMGEQEADDVRLFFTGRRGAGAAASGILNCEVQRRRAALVLAQRVSPVGEQRPHGAGGTSPHGAVQRRHAALVLRIWIGASSRSRTRRSPPARPGSRPPTLEPHRTRSGAARRHAGFARERLPSRHEILGDVSLTGRRREVQRRIAGVGVVSNRREEEVPAAGATRARRHCRSSEQGRVRQHPRRRRRVTRNDGAEQRLERSLLVGSPPAKCCCSSGLALRAGSSSPPFPCRAGSDENYATSTPVGKASDLDDARMQLLSFTRRTVLGLFAGGILCRLRRVAACGAVHVGASRSP